MATMAMATATKRMMATATSWRATKRAMATAARAMKTVTKKAMARAARLMATAKKRAMAREGNSKCRKRFGNGDSGGGRQKGQWQERLGAMATTKRVAGDS
jgi:hypothetical protein